MVLLTSWNVKKLKEILIRTTLKNRLHGETAAPQGPKAASDRQV